MGKLDELARARLAALGARDAAPPDAPAARARPSKLDRLAAARLAAAARPQAQIPAPSAARKAQKAAAAAAPRVGGFSRDEILALKRAAVQRERERRRASRTKEERKRIEEEHRALCAAQQEAVARERQRRDHLRMQPQQQRLRRASRLSAAEARAYKAEARRREATRALSEPASQQQRQQQQQIKQQTTPSEATRLLLEQREEAVRREWERARRRDKTTRLAAGGAKGLAELEEAFKAHCGDAMVLPVAQVKRMLQEWPALRLRTALPGKMVAWPTVVEHLESVEQGARAGCHPTEEHVVATLKRKAALLLRLCETTFQELEAGTGAVRPSDLNAVLSNDFDEDVRIVRGGLDVPRYPAGTDAPISWEAYREWILEQLASGNNERLKTLLHALEADPAFASGKRRFQGAIERPAPSPPQPLPRPPAPEASASPGPLEASEERNGAEVAKCEASSMSELDPDQRKQAMRAVDAQIVDLEDRLQVLLANETTRETSRSAAAAEDHDEEAPPRRAEDEDHDVGEGEDEGEGDDNSQTVLHSGRCWLMCERQNKRWLLMASPQDASEPEWSRAREICAEVTVTQVNNPFHMYVHAQLLRSGLEVTRRVGVEELAQLTAHFARRDEHVSLSRSGKHMSFSAASGKERYRCRSLGPSEWSREELEAAVAAEKAMKAWVTQGRIPRQTELVRWLLLHCIVRISGDELDPAEAHVHLLFPGEEERIAADTVLGGVEERQNRVEVQAPLHDAAPDAAAREALVSALDEHAPDVATVRSWLSMDLATLASELAGLDQCGLTAREVKSVLRAVEPRGLCGLAPRDRLFTEWRRKTKRLRAADIYDVFRAVQDTDQPGKLSAGAFVAAAQDSLRLDLPEWQLACWNATFPEYRALLRFVYRQE